MSERDVERLWQDLSWVREMGGVGGGGPETGEREAVMDSARESLCP